MRPARTNPVSPRGSSLFICGGSMGICVKVVAGPNLRMLLKRSWPS